jgi:osmoprotectant transport system ATP-binding protein
MSVASPFDDVALSIRGIRKAFAGSRGGAATVAVQNLTLDVYAGEFLALVGASGSGKTTTLKMINRLIEPDAGQILIAGQPNTAESPEALRRRIGYAFQGVGLFPHLTVAENVAITPRLLGWPERDIRSRVVELMMLVELPCEEYGSGSA